MKNTGEIRGILNSTISNIFNKAGVALWIALVIEEILFMVLTNVVSYTEQGCVQIA